MFMSKRAFLISSGTWAAVGASHLLLPRLARAEKTSLLPRTPAEALGPFYPVDKPLDTDADLTRLRGGSGRATGNVIEISGRVLATDGTPQPNARLEIWQANTFGRYAHAGDTHTEVPLDPHFQGYADLQADANGHFRFLTIKPGAYSVGSFKRAPHIHLDVRGRQRLVTQLYFAADAALHEQDKVLQHDLWGKTNPLPSSIFAQPQKSGSQLDPAAAHYI